MLIANSEDTVVGTRPRGIALSMEHPLSGVHCARSELVSQSRFLGPRLGLLNLHLRHDARVTAKERCMGDTARDPIVPSPDYTAMPVKTMKNRQDPGLGSSR